MEIKMLNIKKAVMAEFLGTMWLVLGGCGSAVLAASITNGIGLVGVSLAFGLTVLTMAYAIGHVSGCHLNPAVTVGLYTAGRFHKSHVIPYIIAQVAGAILASVVIYFIASGKEGFAMQMNSLAVNGFDELSPNGYGMISAIVTEILLTFMFLIVILGATDRRAPAGFAPIAIGLCLTLIHLISIPITNTSVNPARSTGPALIVAMHSALALKQLWLFWFAPLVGAVSAGLVYKWCDKDCDNSKEYSIKN
jgi:aquaporin Z